MPGVTTARYQHKRLLVQSIDVEEIANATFGLEGGAIGIFMQPTHCRADTVIFPWYFAEKRATSLGRVGTMQVDRMLDYSKCCRAMAESRIELACPAPGGGGYGSEMGTRFLQLFHKPLHAENSPLYVMVMTHCVRSNLWKAPIHRPKRAKSGAV